MVKQRSEIFSFNQGIIEFTPLMRILILQYFDLIYTIVS